MTESSEVTRWQKLREFAAIKLDESYVLSWHIDREMLLVDIDVLLMPEHPFYEKPRPSEKNCIRPAIIEFPYCEKIEVKNSVETELAKVVADLSLGAVSDLCRLDDGRYRLDGDFGRVFITAERPILRLKDA